MAGYAGYSMSNNAIEAYKAGKKPVFSITKEDIENHEIKESLSFFQWYVKNCCKSCERHHTGYRFKETEFYNIADCCDKFKKANIVTLKAKYKQELDKKRRKK